MPTIRSAADAVTNYQNGTANRAAYWKQRAAAANWQAGAGSAAAAANWKAGIQAAVAANSQNAGVMATPNSVYQNGINTKGDRYASGTAAAGNKMNAVMNKLLPDIAAAIATLPPRGPRGSAVNITQRGTGLQQALTKNRGKYKARGI